MARDEKLRIRDAVLAAKQVGYKLIPNSPLVEPTELKVIKPKIAAEGEIQQPLVYYIGCQLWRDFLFHYERYPDVVAALAGIEIQYYAHTPRESNGAAAK